jgi:predicted dehydrogenase
MGLLGGGAIATRVHLRALHGVKGVEISAFAEADSERRAALRRLLPAATPYEDYRELIEAGSADAVLIALPTGMHAEAATHALDAGMHLYLEKPLATTVEEARSVVDAHAATRVTAMIGFNFRFQPLYRRLRDQVEAGRVGRVVAVRTAFSAPTGRRSEWKRTRATGGGALLDLASHHVDLIRFLLGSEVVEVGAQLESVHAEEDTASLQMRMSDGVLASCFVSLATVDEDRVEVIGDAGMLTAERFFAPALRFTPPRRPLQRRERLSRALEAALGAASSIRQTLAPAPEPSFSAALQAFADAARNGAPAPVPLADGLRCLQVVEAAEEAARSSRVVSLVASP